jgi:hypothetical protein
VSTAGEGPKAYSVDTWVRLVEGVPAAVKAAQGQSVRQRICSLLAPASVLSVAALRQLYRLRYGEELDAASSTLHTLRQLAPQVFVSKDREVVVGLTRAAMERWEQTSLCKCVLCRGAMCYAVSTLLLTPLSTARLHDTKAATPARTAAPCMRCSANQRHAVLRLASSTLAPRGRNKTLPPLLLRCIRAPSSWAERVCTGVCRYFWSRGGCKDAWSCCFVHRQLPAKEEFLSKHGLP